MHQHNIDQPTEHGEGKVPVSPEENHETPQETVQVSSTANGVDSQDEGPTAEDEPETPPITPPNSPPSTPKKSRPEQVEQQETTTQESVQGSQLQPPSVPS